jgi:hypothetical protein
VIDVVHSTSPPNPFHTNFLCIILSFQEAGAKILSLANIW